MKTRKLRGKKRILKNILEWKKENHLPSIERIKESGSDYLNVRISPWSDMVFTWSKFPNANKAFRRIIIEGLVEKLHKWNAFLEKKMENYRVSIYIHSFDINECYIKVIDLDKDIYRTKQFNDSLDTDDSLNGFKWNKSPSFIYLDDEDISLGGTPTKEDYTYSRRINRRIKRHKVTKDEYGNYPIPNGYIFEGVKA